MGRSAGNSPNVSEFIIEGNKYSTNDDSESFDNILDNLDKDELTRYKKDVKDMIAKHENGLEYLRTRITEINDKMKHIKTNVGNIKDHNKLVGMLAVMMYLEKRGLGKPRLIGEGTYTHELNNMMEPFRRVINYLGAIPKDFIP